MSKFGWGFLVVLLLALIGKKPYEPDTRDRSFPDIDDDYMDRKNNRW